MQRYISTTKAKRLARKIGIHVSRVTIIRWCRRYGLGHQLGDKGSAWAINAGRYQRFIRGKIALKELSGEEERTRKG